MEALVRYLLSYTQVSKFVPPSEPADAAEALASTLDGLSGVIAQSGARITSDPLPSLFVHGTHLHQLFQNLISNAIKYPNPARMPTVHVMAERSGEQWIFT